MLMKLQLFRLGFKIGFEALDASIGVLKLQLLDFDFKASFEAS